MFAHAFRRATCFTRPVVISRRYFDRSTECGCGAFVVINDEGWIVTAAHLLFPFGKDNPKWITNLSYWWGMDGVQLTDIRPLPEGDLALGRLTPFDPNAWADYPVFKSPGDLGVGTALCKIGYPFQKIQASFREANNSFDLGLEARTLACFPMEGLYTRTLSAGKSGDGRYDIKFLETSSPGFKGQSGGPILDENGTIWGVQSRTDHYTYGVISRTEKDGREIEEDQCINLGVGIHPEVIVRFLEDNGIRFARSDY